jgi:hypothetical protein
MIYKKIDGRFLKGESWPIFLRVDARNYYEQKELLVLEDGSLFCAGCHISLEELKTALDSGKLTTVIPDQESVWIPYNKKCEIYWTPLYEDNTDMLAFVKNRIQELQAAEQDYPKANCITYFKEYLIDATDANLERLKTEYAKVPVDNRLFFELSASKDALNHLMESGKHLNRQQRESILNNYFENQWIIIK